MYIADIIYSAFKVVDEVTVDHTIMHVRAVEQWRLYLTACVSVLKRVVNTLNIHSNNVNKRCD